MIGKTLAHYSIQQKLGAGGMGEVYRAEDLRLRRQVAIKVLPDIFSQDPERQARFQREAKLLATLSHPHIAAIHGLEESEGRPFLVLELVEGETLAQRLRRGPLPAEEALDVCRMITEGLEAAHEKGIVHRDLKPSNIMFTPEGSVKILDFGLARAVLDRSPAGPIAESPTITAEMTLPGVALGTAAYMSPEQAKGKAVDKRADIWAFGCILFECLTGKQAFPGETITEVLAAILKSEPDWTVLPEGTPFTTRALLMKCLQKDPGLRLHDIADARIDMQAETVLPMGAPPAPGPSRVRPAVAVAACAAALVLGSWAGPAVWRIFNPGALPVEGAVIRSSVRLEPDHWLGNGRDLGSPRATRPTLAVPADGRFLVYSAIEAKAGPDAKSRLYLRSFDKLEATAISGTEGGAYPFLSPDGSWVGFWAEGKLMKVPVTGGIPMALCDVKRPFGFSWGADGRIVFAPDRGSGLMTISADGGKPEKLTVPDRSKDEYAHGLPHYLPDGKSILFTIKSHPWDLRPRVAVLDLAAREWRTLVEDGADARFVPSGHLAFLRRGTLMAAPVDRKRLDLTGQPVPVVANVGQALNTTNSLDDTAAGQFDISNSGFLIYAPGGIFPPSENSLVWVDHTGQVEPVVSSKAPFFAARLSPDGRRIAYSLVDMEYQVWIYDLVRGTATRLTSEGLAEWALWTPDGGRLILDWLKTGVPNLHQRSPDGALPMERLTESEQFQFPGSISPDGETLAFLELDAVNGYDIKFLNMRDRRITPFLNSRFTEMYPEISPDGRWIAYATDESGRMEVYVQPFRGQGRKWQISHEGGVSPLWAPDGRRLFYRSPGLEEKVWVVDVGAGPDFSAGKPRFLIELPGYVQGSPVRTWDISRDGKRFLAAKLGGSGRYQPFTELILVQNWFQELKRLAREGR